MAIRYSNECCNCNSPSYPCMGDCYLKHIKHLYCDKCGEEVEKLYIVNDEELCESCVLERLEVIE